MILVSSLPVTSPLSASEYKAYIYTMHGSKSVGRTDRISATDPLASLAALLGANNRSGSD